MIKTNIFLIALLALSFACFTPIDSFAQITTNLTNGVTNVDTEDPFGDLPILDPTRIVVFLEDFNDYSATYWAATTTEDGTAAATEAIQNATPSQITITNDNADNDLDLIEFYKEIVTFDYGKKTWYEAKFKVSDASETDVIMGLAIGSATSPVCLPVDGVVFHKADGSEVMNISIVKDGLSVSSTALVTLVDDTWVTVSLRWDGVSKITYYVDGDARGIQTVTGYVPDNEALNPMFGIMNGELCNSVAGTKTMTVDYICFIQER